MEMSLELSIGGSYGKSEIEKSDSCERIDSSFPRSDFSSMDLVRKREIQAMRRQEARKKREEKMKKSRINNNSNNNLGLLFVEDDDKLLLESQQFQRRFQDREIKEREKRNGEINDDLNLTLFTENKKEVGCLYPKVQQQQQGYPCVFPSSLSNGSLEQSTSAVSDYQSSSHKGGNSSDTGSHSSAVRSHQNLSIPKSNGSSHPEGNVTSAPTQPIPKIAPPNQMSSTHSTSKPRASPPTKETNVGPVDKPPKPPNQNINAASIMHMPCVTATGNGPNGRTITGFLYKYTKNEVSIMCVCHGSSFSPAEFVEHAGGVDVSHPLKCITVVPSPFR